jgi:prepilin-type N-terminal cleavage/methylation domain-containing protein
MSPTRDAFTLIELLIVVAIIAILAAIAVPNFLEAQTRAKVSRAKADMRSLTTAIEAYRVDYNRYPTLVAPGSAVAGGPSPDNLLGYSPLTGEVGVGSRLIRLTTPIAYITSVIRDVFAPAMDVNNTPGNQRRFDTFDYQDAASWSPGGAVPTSNPAGSGFTSGADWRLSSAGPDLVQAFGGVWLGDPSPANTLGGDYDPTNGTVSAGDIVRIGGGQAPYFGGANRRAYYDRARGLFGP